MVVVVWFVEAVVVLSMLVLLSRWLLLLLLLWLSLWLTWTNDDDGKDLYTDVDQN